MVHFPVIPVTNPVSSAAQITTARGHHVLTLGAVDMPALLKQAMPLLPWGAVGGDTTLPYTEFLSLLLGVLWVDAAGVGKSVSGYIVADTALHRAWTELRKGFTDIMWTPQTRGAFLLSLVAAADSALVDSEQLRLRDGDLIVVPALTLAAPQQAWLEAMTFTRGMLGDAVLGRLAVAGSICYYAEVMVGPRSLNVDDGAFAVHIKGLGAATLASRPAADAAIVMRASTISKRRCSLCNQTCGRMESERIQ
jgi:hypothetical protein